MRLRGVEPGFAWGIKKPGDLGRAVLMSLFCRIQVAQSGLFPAAAGPTNTRRFVSVGLALAGKLLMQRVKIRKPADTAESADPDHYRPRAGTD